MDQGTGLARSAIVWLDLAYVVLVQVQDSLCEVNGHGVDERRFEKSVGSEDTRRISFLNHASFSRLLMYSILSPVDDVWSARKQGGHTYQRSYR